MRRNLFALSNYKIFTGNIGYLIPVNWSEVLPGDIIEQYTQGLIRTAPLNAPVMHPTAVRFHHFFVRSRLLWDDSGGAETGFEAFITGGSDGTKTPTHPYISLNAATVASGDLLDYLGIPPRNYTGTGIQISALPLRAYAMIYNNFYRDQDIVSELTVDTSDGQDTTTNTSLQKVAWPKEPLNIVRSSDSLGDTITIPLLGTAPITGFGTESQVFSGSGGTAYETDGSAGTTYTNYRTASGALIEEDPSNPNYPNIRADLSSSSGVDIGELLLAFGLQRFQEARGKFGHRYVDYQRFYGIKPSDSLAYQPEYLGGGRQVLQFSEVLATDDTNTGTMYGHGITSLKSNRYRRYFNEHGIIMTLMSVVPKPIYCDSIPKKWSRTTKEEYFTPELQFIGDEIVENKEIYSGHSSPTGTFGYGPRYESYRYEPSTVAGEFNPGDVNDEYHFGISYSGDPSLNSTFIECTPSTEPFQSAATDQLYCMVNNSVRARRNISRVGLSKLVF